MTIKASKAELADLIAEANDDFLVSIPTTPKKQQPGSPIVPFTAAPTIPQNVGEEALGDYTVHPVTSAQSVPAVQNPDPSVASIVSTEREVEQLKPIVSVAIPPSQDQMKTASPIDSMPAPERKTKFRNVGISIYAPDDVIVDTLDEYVKKNGIRVKRKGLSLWSRAGLRALDELRRNDPTRFIAIVAMTERDR